MQHLPPASLKILKALCNFHYLTKPQMVELGLAKSVGSLDNHALPYLAPIRDKSTGQEVIPKGKRKTAFYCRSLRYGQRDPSEKLGKQHYMYYLTKAGLDRVYWEFQDEFLSGAGDLQYNNLWIPSPKDTLSNDYHHRRLYVSTHIAIRQWAKQAGAKIDFFTHDYQGDPSRPRLHGKPPSVNQVVWDKSGGKSAKPDGIICLTYRGKSRIFVLELHHRTPTKLVIDQLYRNFCAAKAIRAKFPDFSVNNDPYVLSVHATPNTQKAVMGRVLSSNVFEQVQNGLFFALLANLNQKFDSAWAYANGEPVTLFR